MADGFEDRNVTPLQIQMMLHYYACAAPYSMNDPAHASSPAVSAQRTLLCQHGLLMGDTSSSGYSVTERGLAYVKALCAMPFPIQKWVMP